MRVEVAAAEFLLATQAAFFGPYLGHHVSLLMALWPRGPLTYYLYAQWLRNSPHAFLVFYAYPHCCSTHRSTTTDEKRCSCRRLRKGPEHSRRCRVL